MAVKEILIDYIQDGELMCFRLTPETFAELLKKNHNPGPWKRRLFLKREDADDYAAEQGSDVFQHEIPTALTGMIPEQLAECGYEQITYRAPIAHKVLRTIAIP